MAARLAADAGQRHGTGLLVSIFGGTLIGHLRAGHAVLSRPRSRNKRYHIGILPGEHVQARLIEEGWRAAIWHEPRSEREMCAALRRVKR